MTSLAGDLRLAFRLLAKRPGLSGLAVLALGLGIGANTTAFSIINSVLLRPLPVREPDRLVTVYTSGGSGNLYGGSSFADFLEIRRLGVFNDALAYAWAPLTYSHEQGAERIWAQIVSPNYFSVLGVRAALGRTLSAGRDLSIQGASEVVVSHGFWRRELGGDSNVAGKQVRLNGQIFSVVGVAPEDFQGTEMARIPEMWISSASPTDLTLGAFSPTARRLRVLGVVGRLEEGVSVEQAADRLRTLAGQLAGDLPDSNANRVFTVMAANRARVHPFVQDSVTSYLAFLMALVSILLLVACGNLASLLLVQGLRRQSEVAVRISVGASRWRLIRQFLVESVLLATLGGTVGLLFALWSTRMLGAIELPEPLPVALSLAPDLRVFGFTLLLALLVGVVFGLAPALRATRPEVTRELKSQAPAGLGRSSRLLNGFVVLQVAFSVVLLIAASLFLRSLRSIQDVNLGFNPQNVLVASFQLGPMSGYTPERSTQFYDRLLAGVRATPGVRSVTLTSLVPTEFGGLRGAVFPEGLPVDSDRPPLESDITVVGPGYFATMAIRLLSGRTFGEQDTGSSPPVAVVNTQLAKVLWGTTDVVGRRLGLFRAGGDTVEVIGVAETTKYHAVREQPTPMVYLYYTQLSEPLMSLVVRTETEPLAAIGAVRNEVRALDPDLPAFNVRTLEEQIERSLFTERVAALLSTALAFVALLQALVGLYVVLAYSVGQRTREIGVRMALGARRESVLRLIVGHAMRLTWFGILAGLLGAWAAARMVSVFLYGVTSTDLLTYIGIPVLVALLALLASVVPLRRAFRVSPVVALRGEV